MIFTRNNVKFKSCIFVSRPLLSMESTCLLLVKVVHRLRCLYPHICHVHYSSAGPQVPNGSHGQQSAWRRARWAEPFRVFCCAVRLFSFCMPLCCWVDGNPRETCDPQIRKWVLHPIFTVSPWLPSSPNVLFDNSHRFGSGNCLWVLSKQWLAVACIINYLWSSISMPDAAAVWPSEWGPSSPSLFFKRPKSTQLNS